MSNTYATCALIAKEALPILENMCSFSTMVNRDYEDEFTGNMTRGYAPGQTINIKKPPRYTYRAGRVAQPQATVENTVPITLSQGGCDLFFTSAERTLSLTKLEDKIQAAIAPVANEIDRQGLQLAHYSTFNCLGTPGTAPNTQALALAAITGANQRLDEMATPRDKRRAFVMNPALNAATVTGLAGMFNASDKLSRQYGSGMMVDSLGIAYAMDQNVDTHVNGTQAVAGVNISGANQTGASITTAALTGGGISLTRGTVISLPGSFAVNPQSRVSTGTLMQFVVTADVASGATSIPISPPIVTSGAFQNVSASPTTGQPFTVFGTVSAGYATNVAFHKDAFTLAMVPMWQPPKGVVDVHQETHNGFTLKVTEYYDGGNDTANIRIDVLFGWAATYAELSTKYAL